MSREAHVPFYEGLPGKFRRSTHQDKRLGKIENLLFQIVDNLASK